ncbi:TetR/AcrR family transcriptional regulator [Ligilactobacillus salivarius]|uniref:Transcriptional regulator, TetR family n=2 Tax=Ligilactobacillus salivarius TaxID=1624 RepID=C2EGP6_9LACO|nr:TetR/AcrR family transcriptional regulator [Ligilactobacillus salivarius]ATP37200.1 TetR/AcrR family transcriptional regulator [Ligilactobacillus salivarius]EEJ74318.1 transcriptional regulator, TetR family [Ligilactobacillus salivarius DSM 20555 = ATCC 11741]KRM69160.1 TetR family transcriptional regulator [Ligilactobacillus salivarius DSM 20555 = ATCC 11741]MBE7938168.1 TetR/AcrR family transcriptional regulator [Ligilactobacillus salivarius]MBS5940988.1 TetR/AcrR family transcriptional r
MKKTELKLESGLVKALENESFNQLTVAELVAAAGISRRSFYIYYKDKYEFLNDVRSRILKGIKQAMEADRKVIEQFEVRRLQTDEEKYLSTHDEFYKLAVFINENSDMVRTLFSRNATIDFYRDFMDLLKEEITIRNSFHKITYGTMIPNRYAEEIFAGEIISTIRIWVSNYNKESMESIDEFLDILGKIQIISPYHLFRPIKE